MKSSFQTIIIIIFAVGFVGAVAVFSGLISFGSKTDEATEPQGVVVVWGVLPNEAMQKYVQTFNGENRGYTISYIEQPKEVFTQLFITSLADQNPPDVVLVTSELYASFRDKLYTVPYVAYSERTYRDTYVDGAQLFLEPEGIAMLPVIVDPLVVYYNKDILATENFVVPPRTWNTLAQAVPLFTKRDAQNGITQATIGLGDSVNVIHMRDILSTLFLQTGNKIVTTDPVLLRKSAVLSEGTDMPSAQALSFYISFADPTNSNYSWNRSLPDTLQMFLAGKSAFYIGRASELFSIQEQNPNLNFDVQELFQAENAARPVTFGSFIGAGIVKSAPNFQAAYAFASTLATREGADVLSKELSVPPARRDLLLVQQNNPYISVFFRAALSAFSWQDPSPIRTEEIFRAMITDVTSGRSDSQTAIYEATRDLQSIIR